MIAREIWDEAMSRGVTRVRTPLPKAAWNELYRRLTTFAEFITSNDEFSRTFDAKARDWQINSGLRLHYSGYFSPYYRNRVGQPGRDNKIIFQMCEPYYRYLAEHDPALFTIPEFRSLADGAMAALFSSLAEYTPLIEALRDIDASLAHRLITRQMLPPVSIRLLRYYSDKQFFTNPHVDKSAITVILDTDEPVETPCLVFAPRSAKPPALSTFAPIQRRPDESLLFFGAAAMKAGYRGFEPSAHAVRPLLTSSVRHVAIFFWLLPGIDLASFNTSTAYVDDLGLSRADRPAYD